MKRIKMLLFFVILLLTISNVKAENTMPTLHEVEAIVTNQNGLRPKFSSEVIPYNTKIKITKLEDKVYYNLQEIDINDVDIIESDFNNSLYDTLNSDMEVKILKKDGVELYSGPSLLYPKTNIKLNENDTLKCSSLSSNDVFVYCTRYKESAWLYTYNQNEVSVAFKEEGSLYTLKSSYAIYDFPTKSQTKKVISQQKYSELNYSYYVVGANNSRWYYIDSLNGWILEEKTSVSDDSTTQGVLKNVEGNALLILSSRDIPIYKNLDFKDRENKLIPSKSVVNSKYVYYIASDTYDSYTNYYYVEYDGVSGWIKASDADQVLVAISSGDFLHIGNTTNTYKNYDLSSYAKSDSINYFDEVKGYEFEIYNGSTSSYMYYIKLNDNYVWLKENTNSYMLSKIHKVSSASDNLYLYDKSESLSSIKGAIKKNTYYKELYSYSHYSDENYTYYWKYVEYLNTFGWIHVAINNTDLNTYKIPESEEISDDEVESTNKLYNIYKVLEEEPTIEEEQDYSLLIITIIILILFILIIVVLILIKKSKKRVVYTFN